MRKDDDAKAAKLIDWLLKSVPLVWVEGAEGHQTVTASIIRGAADDAANGAGFAFDADDATHVVRKVHRAEEVPALSVGDLIVRVDGSPLQRPLREAVEPESVSVLDVWKKGAMAALRFQAR